MTTPPPRVIRLNPMDNIGVALADLEPACPLPGGVVTGEPVKRGHKVALADIAAGAPVYRYGQMTGAASAPIAAGGHVHSHNLGMGDHRQDHAFGADCRALAPIDTPRQFMGYHRADGQVGTRNYLGILTSVNCSG